MICQQIFSILALVFLLKVLLKNLLQNRLFVAVASRSGLELQFPTPLRVVLLCLATQSVQIAL